MNDQSKHANLKLILGIGVAAILCGWIGYMIANQSNTTTEDATTVTSPKATSSATATATSTPASSTSDWKTYTNTPYSFSVKYPTDWILADDAGTNTYKAVKTLTSPETDKANKTPASGNPYCEGCGPDIQIYYHESVAKIPNNEKAATTMADFISQQSDIIKKVGETTVGGAKATQTQVGGFGLYYVVYVEKDGHVYEIFFNNAEKESDLTATEKLILSNFTFTK